MQQVLLMCRPGFESDLAAEIQDKASACGVFGFVRARAGDGFVVFEGHEPAAGRALLNKLSFADVVFARQWLLVIEHFPALPVDDRVGPLVQSLSGGQSLSGLPFRHVWMTFPDTNAGKGLSKLTRKLERPLARSVAAMLQPDAAWFGHVFFLSGREAWVGYTPVANGSPWPLGFPRLRQPAAAPSRSTLKLEEAWLQLIPEFRRATLLKPFQKAVDLGAAPGGWTWQLVQRGMQVVAIDNGPMDQALMESGQVTHLREDAFAYKPQRPVDWLVCDMVEKPARVAQLMERWLARGWTRYAIFNLKLPMKRRWLEVQQILEKMQVVLDEAGSSYRLQAKQLYHDREEITVFAAPHSGGD
ncbi:MULTISPECIES: 23S rRNA (cytidine(2498)-2'-O)-methyltransferase RlmM [unclassified Ketobacter]|uniref:23S rRNA (cytidine(2498)-2'-O)-methyltransferase RlmM n=1 Tax=unclassified Ketobacter TaxID=2639109 RepID=UPI000F1B1508|nr:MULTISPECIES: 23S rRNA (cytidine(2498)-2'-O)-methyltransferase RlmM [unclassified Ketobacter]RLT88824.1 MAG: 23S rRNA (cytidine(2498)-2'-O)-methyltransferase RlmM [Ketobacter sp. GenoA1]RLT97575.1 MAG: 23S rRNA (cytidine(2498)-2'-O)-methyltransferase RlmM [Ketobacter sp.]